MDTTAALVGVAAAACLVPAGLRLALDQAGSTLAAPATALLLLAFAAGVVIPGRPNWLSAILRLLAAVVTAPLLLFVVRPVYALAWPLLGGNAVGSFGLRLVLLAAVLLLPAIAAGGVFRLAVRPTGSSLDGAGLPAGFRPGIAAAAASLGLAFGGAVLLPILGLRLAAAVGLGLCLVGAALALRSSPPRTADMTAPAARGADVAFPALVAGVAMGIAGVCWLRTLALVAGPTDATALVGGTMMLLGLAAGAILLPSMGRSGRAPLAIVAFAAGALLIDASAFLVPGFSIWCAGLVAGGSGPASGMLAILSAIVLILPASLAFGCAIACLGDLGRGDAGADAGGAVAPLAAGAAAGILLGAGLLVPTMGLRRGLALAAALGLFAILPSLAHIRFRRPALKGSASLAILIAMVLVGGFPASWDPRVTAGGVYRYAVGSAARFDDPDGWLAARLRGAPPEFYREGRHATVTVESTVQRATASVVEAESLLVDGRAIGNSGIDARTQILEGEIPMLVHGPADSALVIDFSLGLTAGSVLRHPVRSLTVIEREPAVLEAAPIFGALANNPAGDSRLRVVHDDPRARLRVEPMRYDVIVLTGTDPWLPHLAGLITDEGYALLRSRLQEKGILAQRFSLGAAPDAVISAWMRSFLKAFPSVLLFQTSPDDLLLVGSVADLRVDPEAIQKTAAANAAVADDLSRATIIGSDEIFLTLRVGTEALRKALGEGPSNPEDRRWVTVQAARDLRVQRQSKIGERIDGAWEGLASMLAPPADATAKETRAALLYRLAKSYLGLAADPERALSLAKDLEGLGATTRARWVTGEALLQRRDIDGALKEWEAVLAAEPDNLDALFSLGMFHFDARDYFDAERYLAHAVKAHGDTAVVLYNHGRALYQTGRYEPAIEELTKARSLASGRESYPLVDYFVGLSAARLKRDTVAEKALRDYLKWAYAQDTLTRVEVDAHIKLAEVLERRGSRLEGFQERQKASRLQERIQAYAASHAGGAGANAGRPDVPVPEEPATAPPESPAAPPHPSDGR